MTNLDTRDEAETIKEKEKTLLLLHDAALSVFDSCTSILSREQTIKEDIEDYEPSDEEVGNLVDDIVKFCDIFADIVDIQSELVAIAGEIRIDFNAKTFSEATNHEIVQRVQALAKKLARQALNAWAKL